MFDLAISDLVSFLVHNAVSGRCLQSWLSNTNGWRCWYPSTGIEGQWKRTAAQEGELLVAKIF